MSKMIAQTPGLIPMFFQNFYKASDQELIFKDIRPRQNGSIKFFGTYGMYLILFIYALLIKIHLDLLVFTL